MSKTKTLGRPRSKDPRGNKHSFRLNEKEEAKFKTGLEQSKEKHESVYIRKKVLK